MPPPLPVLSPSTLTGGVEGVARAACGALRTHGIDAALHEGMTAILRSPSPDGVWFAATWKVHLLAAARHPVRAHRGLLFTHGAELTRDTGGPTALLRHRVLSSASLLLAVSPLSLSLLPAGLRGRAELIGPPIRVTTTSDALDRLASTPATPLRMISVGRAVPRKGHDLAIAVARQLSASTPVRLDVVGPGPDLPRLHRLAGAPDERLDVRVHGFVPESEKARLLREAHVLLFLPRAEAGEFEGLGLVVLEAASLGVPAVVLDCGGSRYGVADGHSGHVLPAGSSPEALAAAAWELAHRGEARFAAARFAARFSLAEWQRRVAAVACGRRPGWTWPTAA